MNKITIILVCGKNPLTSASGYATHTYSTAKILVKLGFRVEIYCIGKINKTMDSQIGKIYTVKSNFLKIRYFENIEMALFPFLCIGIGFRIIKNLTPETIVWGVGPWSLSGVIVKIFSKKNIIFFSDYFTSINHEFYNGMLATRNDYGLSLKITNFITYYTFVKLCGFLEKLIFIYSDKIIVHYNSTQKILASEFGISKNKFVKLSYSPVFTQSNLNSKIESKIKFSKPFILLVCRQDGRKGINYLLRAFSILDRKNIKYSAAIIGKGKLFEANKKIIEKLNLSNVKLLGYVKSIESYLKNADIYVFPSVEEGSSAISLLEAASYGLPIISTYVDGIPEDFSNNHSALLVPPKNPKALADAMEKLIIDPKLANKLAQNAKLKYFEKYNTKKTSQDIEKFILSEVLRFALPSSKASPVSR